MSGVVLGPRVGTVVWPAVVFRPAPVVVEPGRPVVVVVTAAPVKPVLLPVVVGNPVVVGGIPAKSA